MPDPSFPKFDEIDASAEACFDRITRLAAQGLGVPAVLFSLAEARFGSTGQQDALSLQLCAEAPVHGPDGHEAGTLCVFDVHAHPLEDSKRAMLADFAVLLERELAANKLRHSGPKRQDNETAIRELLDHMPEGVMMLGEDGVILACNAVAETMYSAAENGLVGRNSNDLVGEDPARLGDLMSAGKTDQLEAIARRIDGSLFPVEFSIKILQASGAYRYSLFARDISARKADEQKAQIAEARRRKYFVTATHELRTPMASVLGFSELLLKYEFEHDERIEIVTVIHRQTSRLVNLINEMLDLARIEAGGKDELDISPHDPAAILEQTLTGLDGLNASSRIHRYLAPDLPHVLADSAKLQQALTNLISNAIKYSNAASQISIDVFETETENEAMIGFRVIDKGIGMTPEQKAKIFTPFYRARSDPDTAGTGLGMTIFREIVALHGGMVTIDSQLGVGTQVVLLLPATRASC